MSFRITAGTRIRTNMPDSKPLKNAVEIFRRDMENTLAAQDAAANTIIINVEAALGFSPEQFRITCRSADELVISAGDELGAVYGLLHLSEEYLGVDPFWFWRQQQFVRRGWADVPMVDYVSPYPRVRFRGWFINDEVLLSEWQYSGCSENVWRLVFETLLRCRGNMVIPGTDHNSRKYRQLAVDMGLWITHHHAEPLGAEMFSRVYPDKVPSYLEHKDLFTHLWEQAVLEQKAAKVVWNVGFRGQGDRAFWVDDHRIITPQERGALISQVIRDQCELVRRHVPDPIFCTNLYGEILGLYREGFLDIPHDVIKIWGDSGYGKMVSRRQGNINPRHEALADHDDPGLNGIYFHASFYDLQASNHITMSPNPPELLNAELDSCLERSMDQYWIINCGNVKPHAYILDLIRRKWVEGALDTRDHLDTYLRAYYPQEHVAKLEELYSRYFRSTIQYGAHVDEKAGEQFYHHPARRLITAAVQNKADQCVDSLRWATGSVDFAQQVRWFMEKCAAAAGDWEALYNESRQLCEALPESDRRRFYGELLVQVEIHYTGCLGFIQICRALLHWLDREYMPAFVAANRGLNYYRQGAAALERAEDGIWLGFYANECLTNVRLTVYCCESFCRYLRIVGDGPSFHRWERDYLYTVQDQKVMLLTNTKNHLSDSDLFARLEPLCQSIEASSGANLVAALRWPKEEG